MTDLPIIFSAPMVRALLREIEKPGTGKTQTRRVLTVPDEPFDAIFNDEGVWRIGDALTGQREAILPVRYKPGDRLWVREAWQALPALDPLPPSEMPTGSDIIWLAEREYARWDSRYRNARFMPRWASRITLIITDVRVERLQDISEADAIAEGILRGTPMPEIPTSKGDIWHSGIEADLDDPFSWYRYPMTAFAHLWISLNGLGSLEENPWVAAYTFRPILGNIDQIGDAI